MYGRVTIEICIEVVVDNVQVSVDDRGKQDVDVEAVNHAVGVEGTTAELAVHPSDKNDIHKFFLICDDLAEFVDDMRQLGIETGKVKDEGWGLLTEVTLPGGGQLGVYEPRHARPDSMSTRSNS